MAAGFRHFYIEAVRKLTVPAPLIKSAMTRAEFFEDM
jgi:hypothetical protein